MSSTTKSVRRFGAICCVVLGLGCAPFASAQCIVESEIAVAIQLLQKAGDNFTVRGTFLRESSLGRDFVAVTQSSDEQTRTAQFINSSGINAEQTFRLPYGRYLTPCEIVELYTVTLALGPTVAGRPTRLLHLRPKDTLRLGHILALDEESNVILRSDTFSEKGELLERHEYATVTIESLDEVKTNDRSSRETPRFLKVPGLPKGYRASLALGYEGQALFVSDGVAAATVIFEPLPNTVKPGEGAVRRGATLTYTRGSLVSGKNILVTVIGEVPLAAARVIADAVKLTVGQR